MIKIFTLIIIMILVGIRDVEAQKKKRNDSVNVVIHFNNALNNNAPIDSVLVIFDRYDLSGAGVIKKIFYPDNNKVIIKNVPKGKYYIDIYCLGIYQQCFSEVTFVYDKRKNKNTFQFRVKISEEYNPASVYIPAEKIDLNRLSIIHPRSNK